MITNGAFMGDEKILIAIQEEDVAPRFDLTAEILLAEVSDRELAGEPKTMVLPQASAEDLCHLILAESVDVVICGGIEEEFYDYLTWKKVRIIDSVMGPWNKALELFTGGLLEESAVLFDRAEY